MLKKIAIIIMTLIFSLSMFACGEAEKKRYEGSFLQLFDTATNIIGYAYSKEEFSEYVQIIYDELEVYHQLYDIYNDYEGVNNIKTINDNAGIAPVEVDQKIIDLLLFGRQVHAMSEGNVNIALGSVLSIWHDYRELGTEDPLKAKVPPMDDLKAAADHVDIENMIIDEEAKTVYLSDPEMSLDIGGIAKGYATEKVSRLVMEKGFTDGLISVGGNVRTFGFRGAKNELWNIGIQNPEMGEADLYTVKITDKSLVTSGDYIRYYTVDGKRYHHIIDPDTLMPADFFRAVTIICEDSGMADALSTMLYNMNFEQGYRFIEESPDTEAVWIFTDGDKKYSSGFEPLLKVQ